MSSLATTPLTASRLALAEACPYSVVIPGQESTAPTEYRDRGVALHAYLSDVTTLGVEAALARVPEKFRAEAESIDLSALPHSSPESWAVEVAFAYDVAADSARELYRGGAVHRDYSTVDFGREMAGTADIVAVTESSVVVLDVKTGNGALESPDDAPQLLFLALAACRAYGRTSATVGWIRLREGDTPRFQTATLDAVALDFEVAPRIAAIAEAVASAREAWRRSPGDAKPQCGAHCRHCPAYSSCPTVAITAREWALATTATEIAPLHVPDELLPGLLRSVEAGEVLLKRVREYLEGRARQQPIPTDETHEWGPGLKLKEFVLAEAAEPVLRDIHPELAALAVTSKLTTSKSAITEAIRRVKLPPGETQTSYSRKLLKALRAANAVTVREDYVFEVRKKKVPELPAEGES